MRLAVLNCLVLLVFCVLPLIDSRKQPQQQQDLIDIDATASNNNNNNNNADGTLNNKPQPNFYFHQPKQAKKQKQGSASHQIINRNAASAGTSSSAVSSRLLKQKQGRIYVF